MDLAEKSARFLGIAELGYFMSELKKCIEIHKLHSHHTPFADTFGDGFLYHTSPLFKKIRDSVLACGTTIENSLTAESRDFFLSHLFQLDTVLFQKKLYARQNFGAFLAVQQKYSHLDISLSEISILECYSTLLHESTHILCSQYFGWKSIFVNEQKNPQQFLQQLIAAESMAITNEFLVSVAYDDPDQRALSFINSLGNIQDENRTYFNQLVRLIGYESAALWLFRGYFVGNYFYQGSVIPPGFFNSLLSKIAEEESYDPRAYLLIEHVLNIGFSVKKAFRYQTASVFFKLIGIEGDLKNAMSFDLYSALGNTSDATKVFRHFFPG